MGHKPILLNLFHYLASSWSPFGDPSWSVMQHALSPCCITPRNGDPLRASDRASCSPLAACGRRTTGEDTGEDKCTVNGWFIDYIEVTCLSARTFYDL